MQPLVETHARALQREILLPAAEIERTHRRVAVLRLEQERLRGFPGSAERDRLGLVPGPQAFLDTGAIADDHQVQRIALQRSARVTGCTRLPLNPGAERIDV